MGWSHDLQSLSNTFLRLLLAAWALLPNKNPYHIAGPALRPGFRERLQIARARAADPLHSVIEAQLDPQLFIWDFI